MTLRDRCKEFYQKLKRDAVLRQGSPVDDLMAFIMGETPDRMSLEELLRTTFPVGPGCIAPEGTPASPDFRVSIQNIDDSGVHFIIHAQGHDSETLDFAVRGNYLMPV